MYVYQTHTHLFSMSYIFNKYITHRKTHKQSQKEIDIERVYACVV